MENNNAPVQGPGPILLAATPIEDVANASSRFIRTLDEAKIIVAEDTRRPLGLVGHPQTRITGTLVSLHDHNEADKAERFVDLAEGRTQVLLVPDAGTPTVSDPRFQVVRAAVNRGVQASILSGPSAPITAPAVSGFPSGCLSFERLLPRKPGEVQAYSLVLAHNPHILIPFESSRRFNEILRAMVTTSGPQRQGVVCRELAKTHEKILHGEPKSSMEQTTGEVFGEITTVIVGYRGRGNAEERVPAVLALISKGMRLKDAAAGVAEATGLRKNELYEAALRHKEEG